MDQRPTTTTPTPAGGAQRDAAEKPEPAAGSADVLAQMNERLAGLEAENRRLKLSEQHYRRLIENSGDLIAVLGRTGAIEYCSPACERMLDYSLEELLHKNMREFLHPEDRARTLRSIEMFVQTPGAEIRREFRLRRRDGRWQHFESTVVNLLADPAVRGIVVNAHDITERVRMEAFFRASLVEKETLLREIHHRVKNNLQLISSMLGLQAHQIEDERVAKIFRDSKDRIRSMALIHEQLYQSKNLSEIRLGEYLTTLVRHLLGAHHPAGAAGAIGYRIKVGEVRLEIDRMIHLGLLVNEIVTNSLKHAFPDGRTGEIAIEACEYPDSGEAGGAISITIMDTGIGIRSEAGAEAGARTLGLHLVSMLATQLGGTIQMTTGTEGTAYTITLPRLHQA